MLWFPFRIPHFPGWPADATAQARALSGVGGFDHQVKMIAQEAEGVNLEAGPLVGLGQSFDKILPVDIGLEDHSLAVGPDHHTCPAEASGEGGW
jgi:hypothetical protein